MKINLLRFLSTICVSILLANVVFAQDTRKIGGIETEGLQSLTTETVIATSGLKVGDTFSVEAIDAAAERLLSSGLFKRVAYRRKDKMSNPEPAYTRRNQWHLYGARIQVSFMHRRRCYLCVSGN